MNPERREGVLDVENKVGKVGRLYIVEDIWRRVEVPQTQLNIFEHFL